uniref:Uncharacterized protein n=1 Tax=Lepeophtheirus salmonis TaxID=72036 RepID=A0A0K2TTV9_LEPSM
MLIHFHCLPWQRCKYMKRGIFDLRWKTFLLRIQIVDRIDISCHQLVFSLYLPFRFFLGIYFPPFPPPPKKKQYIMTYRLGLRFTCTTRWAGVYYRIFKGIFDAQRSGGSGYWTSSLLAQPVGRGVL